MKKIQIGQNLKNQPVHEENTPMPAVSRFIHWAMQQMLRAHTTGASHSVLLSAFVRVCVHISESHLL